MTTWKITDRVTGEVVHAYSSDDPIDWPDMGFARYNHIAVVEPPPTPVHRRITRLQYMRRFTQKELEDIYTAAKSNISVEIWLAKFNIATLESDGTGVDLDDQETINGLSGLEYLRLIAAGRPVEIRA